MRAVLTAVLMMALAGPAVAQRRAERADRAERREARDCPRPDGWQKPERHVAAKGPRFQFGLKFNTSHQLQLHVQRSVNLATREGKKGWMNRYAGLAALDVPKAGKLQVAMSSRAYADLVENGRTLRSTAHGRANCGGVFKTVTFDVKPGRHVLQITDSQAGSIRVGTILK